MAKFLNSACIASATPKIVETKYGYLFNGTYYNKKTFVPESIADSVINGHADHVELNSMASMPVYDLYNYAGLLNTSTRGNRLIADEHEADVYYIFTEDIYTRTHVSEKYCVKVKETPDSFEILEKRKYTNTAADGWHMMMTQYIGQSKTKLYVLMSSTYTPNASDVCKTYFCIIDKITLVCNFKEKSATNYSSFSKILDLKDYAYVYYRLSGSKSQIWRLDKKTDTFSVFKDNIPAFTGEIANRNIFACEAIMTSPTEGYFVDIDEKLTTTQSRIFKFQLKTYHRMANTTNGQPQDFNLRKEVSYTLHGYTLSTNHSPCPLFRKNNHNATYNNPEVAYWSGAGQYVDITFDEDVNIWRAGTSNYVSYNNKFLIKKYNQETESWDDISSTVTQTLTTINHLQWEKTIENLPAGRYRFEYAGLRMDGGWYLEKIAGEDYFGEVVTGIKTADDITIVDNEMLLKEPEMKFPQSVNTTSGIIGVQMFITDHNNTRYFHKAHYAFSTSEIDVSTVDRATIKTYKIDETSDVLTYMGESPLSNMQSGAKAICLNKDKTLLLGLSKGNTFIHKFDPIEEKYIPLKYFPIVSKSIGFDEDNNIWILNDKNELLKYNESIPESLEILFEDTNLDYAGEEINTFITLQAKNYLNVQLESTWLLKISGNAQFENGTKETEVTTLAEGLLNVPMKITGSGVILVYPVLKLDVKNKGAIK